VDQADAEALVMIGRSLLGIDDSVRVLNRLSSGLSHLVKTLMACPSTLPLSSR